MAAKSFGQWGGPRSRAWPVPTFQSIEPASKTKAVHWKQYSGFPESLSTVNTIFATRQAIALFYLVDAL